MYPILLTLGENIDKVFSSFDLWVFHFFGSMQCTFLTYVAKFFTTFGDEGFIIPLVVLGIVLCFFKKTRKFGFSLIIAVVIGTLVTNIVVKPMALRIRPYNTLQGNSDYWNWYIGAGALSESDYSFPSGHTTAPVAIILAVVCIFLYAFIPSLTEGGDKAVRCAYNEEYDCYNEARVDDKDYPAIDGKNYCKIHWKQLNDIKE